jgi:hypothetical protein
VPTLRLWRGRVTLAVMAAGCGLLLVLLGNPPWRNGFINPGELSAPHSGAAFMALASTNHLDPSCGACHAAGHAGPNSLIHAAVHADPGMFDFARLAGIKMATPTALDVSCLKCHGGKSFHQPDASPISCVFCHAEHHGRMMAVTTDANCNFCHGDSQKMMVASRGNNPPPLIHHFPDDHPEFAFLKDHWRDPDTLKFNHHLHLTGMTIPNLPGGAKLDCAFCHQPDTAGAYMRPVNFEKNCRVCHSLQFDPDTPQLTLPHGDETAVSAFLRSLPKQYQDLAIQQAPADADHFVEQKLAGLRAHFGSGESLEQRVFFSNATAGPEEQIGTVGGATRAVFPGCALCHEVKNVSGSPQVTRPMMAERWMLQARFNHARHATIACAQCHDAVRSQETADVLLPSEAICATCHNPRSGIVNTCATCHTYHQAQVAAR